MYAYVTVLYGNNIYLTGALVLGYSLKNTGTKFDRVILVTPDVSKEYQSYLRDVYNYVLMIDYVKVSPEIFLDETTRFRDVFTKLASLSLIQYDKILLLDLDMIITQNIDHLFQLKPPAASMKRYDIPYGEKVPAHLICHNKQLVGSINAGVILLKPDMKEWMSIQADINKPKISYKFKLPEQEYLSLRYCHQWTSISFNYNFQFGLTGRVKKLKYKIDQIYIIHYSSPYKPWNEIIDKKISQSEAEFKLLHQKYYNTWLNAYRAIKRKFEKKGIVLPY